MDPVTIAVAIAGAGALTTAVRRRATRLRAWRAAADACGLRDMVQLRVLGLIPSGIRGRVGPLAVTIEARIRGERGSGTVVRVHEGLADIALRSEGFDMAVRKRLLRAQDFEVGDPAFDNVAYVEGSPVVLQALLDDGTRVALRQLLIGTLYEASSGRMFKVSASLRGELSVAFEDDGPVFLKARLPAALRAVLDLARRLVPPIDLAERLARNARQDPLSAVRLRNLEMLRRELPDDPAARPVLRDACADENEVVQLYAATSLGPEGHPVLRRLAASAEQDSCAARAVSVLGASMSSMEALELLETALQQRRLATAAACIDALAGGGGSESVNALSRVLAHERGAVAVAAARALGHADLQGAETILLLRGLAHSEEDVRVAAADALGRVGTVDAVLPLQEAAERRGGALVRAARQAVAEIQSRLSGAAPGQLTVSTEAGGALSITSEGGEVSLDLEGNPR